MYKGVALLNSFACGICLAVGLVKLVEGNYDSATLMFFFAILNLGSIFWNKE